ncbi:MAG TPA: helix-turn-helix domain-containing protein [Gemmatimonadaceae bacterium]|jgi:predicted ArsR family transcriptional regulator|nr:helix-turn-helix domain-containing protein [Gemmatimonadaceae bacterium]
MQWDSKFLLTTRGQIVAELRRGSRTVEDLRKTLGITDNAVRAHLASLEADGIIHQVATRPSGRRPAVVYELTEAAESSFSKAYLPVLTRLVESLSERMSVSDLEILLRDVGERLAKEQPSLTGSLKERAEAAASVLTGLGGVAEVEDEEGKLVIRGFSCPLADAVRTHPATCHAAQGLVSELVGVPVREACDKGERPRCRFEIDKAS